jgi:hypothetical protein
MADTTTLPYTVDEMVGLLWLWSGELSEIANAVQNSGAEPTANVKATPQIDKVMRLKLRRVSREVGEMLENIEALSE